MSILNYFFIGFIFTLLIEYLFNRNISHPLLKDATWDWSERIICILIWPLGLLVFLTAFIKTKFKK